MHLKGLAVTALACSAAAGCRRDAGGRELHARLVILQREVEGLRGSTAKLERGEPILPEDAVVVSVSEDLVQRFASAQLPFQIDLERFAISLGDARVGFTEGASLTLEGTITPRGHPEIAGRLRAIGALDDVKVDASSGTLRARMAVDHVDLLEMSGVERFLTEGTIDELARALRRRIEARIPEIQIPVAIEQRIDLPALTQGPVRMQGASLPLGATVTDVYAGGGRLWIAVRVVPGAVVKSAIAGDGRR